MDPKKGITTTMTISLAVPTYNSAKFTSKSIAKIIDSDYIDEIVISDDFSSQINFIKMTNQLKQLEEETGYKKIVYYRNDINQGPLINKYLAIKRCKNSWVFLLDSDNAIQDPAEFTEILQNLTLEKNTIYCPAVGASNYNFFKDIIDKENIGDYIRSKRFKMFLNNGNFFVPRKTYVEIFENIKERDFNTLSGCKKSMDVLFFNYHWIKAGGRLKVVEDLKYYHRSRKNGNWITHKEENIKTTKILIEKIKELKKEVNIDYTL